MQRRWYKVVEIWLVLCILGGSVVASAWLIHAAVAHPDPPLVEHPSNVIPPSRVPGT